ncbi:hypothetical protein PM082_003552 [Marasmius tenuissimus]|nr:hypothetical protein PM082_003552 [Marasmius tenuissimus]
MGLKQGRDRRERGEREDSYHSSQSYPEGLRRRRIAGELGHHRHFHPHGESRLEGSSGEAAVDHNTYGCGLPSAHPPTLQAGRLVDSAPTQPNGQNRASNDDISQIGVPSLAGSSRRTRLSSGTGTQTDIVCAGKGRQERPAGSLSFMFILEFRKIKSKRACTHTAESTTHWELSSKQQPQQEGLK